MVVAGGGAVATRRVSDLLDAGAEVTVVAPSATPELTAWAAGGRVTLEARPFQDSDLDGAWLALSATDDPGVDDAVLAAAARRQCFASSAQGAEAASLRPLAVLRRGDLEVAVGTSGQSPGLAVWLRDRLGADLGPEFIALVELAGIVRREATSGEGAAPDSFRALSDWYGTVNSGILEAIRAGRWDEAREGLRTCLS